MERHISSDVGDEIWADSVTTDGHGITMAWDAKHTKGGPNALRVIHSHDDRLCLPRSGTVCLVL